MPSFPLVELVLSGTVSSWMPLGTFGLIEAVELDSVEFTPRRKSKEGGRAFPYLGIYTFSPIPGQGRQRRDDCWSLRPNFSLHIFIKVLNGIFFI